MPAETDIPEIPSGQPFSDFWTAKLPQEGSYTSRDETIPVEGGEILVRVVTPTRAGDDETFPVLFFFHGGGWAMGSTEVDVPYLINLSVDLKIVTVNVEYRLAPKYPFPHGLNDCVAAMEWVVNNAASLHVSPARGFVLGGDSAGGNLAAAAAQVSRDDPAFAGANAVTGNLLREPVLVHPDVLPEKYKGELRSVDEDPVFAGLLEQSYQLYAGPKDDPRVSPLLWAELARMPRTYIQINERDPLRDHGVLYEKLLRAEGVPVKLDVGVGFVHGGYYLEPATENAANADRGLRAGLRWLLSGA